MKVFVAGTNQFNFIYLLCKSIKECDPQIVFASLKLKSFDGKYPADVDSVFEKQFVVTFHFFSFLLSCLKSLTQTFFWKALLFILFVEFKVGKALHFWWTWNKEQAFFMRNEHVQKSEIFHFHFIQYSYIKPVWFVPKGRKIVCSFWGSDLLRTSDPLNHFFVQHALQKADIITMQSMEMAEIVLAKYGRHLKPKISIAKLTIDTAIFDTIDTVHTDQIIAFKNKNGISLQKKVIVIGHNASRSNNHLAIAQSLANVSSKDFVVIPFTYGLDVNDRAIYKSEIQHILKSAQIEHLFIEEYQAAEAMAILRCATDIMIHLPESDALSGAATELMFAGGLLITGSWLPYSPFRQAKLSYLTVNDFEELDKLLTEINAGEKFEVKTIDNREHIKRVFFPLSTAPVWVSNFKRLLKDGR